MRRKNEKWKLSKTGRIRRMALCAVLIMTIVMTMIPLCTVSAAQTGKLIAFTFDDGPSKYTTTLLDGLKQRNVPATFFMCGTNGSHGIVNHDALLDRMVEEGHQLANHSWDHPSIAKLSGGQVASEFSRVESLLFRHMGGSYIDMVRTPGGAYNTTIQNNTPAPIIIWSVDPLDWKIRDANSVYNKVVSGAKDGSIVLMHDIYQTSVQGALRAVDTLKSQGYEFVTVSELLRRRGITPSNGIRYYSALNNGTTLPAYQAPAVSSSFDDAAAKTMVTFSTQDPGITMYYTTDGSYPKLSSQKYTGPFPISQDTTFRVVGYDKYGTRTPAAVQTVKKYQAAAPTAVSEDGMITLKCETPGAVIYYTTDGSKPTASSTKYTGPFPVAGISPVLKAVAIKSGSYPSEVAEFAVMDNGMLFSDVDVSRWYYEPVNKAVTGGMMSGMGDGKFAPTEPMNRAMMVQILYNIEGRPDVSEDPANPIPDFKDVDAAAWYAKAVRWAASAGIVKGVTENEFAPKDNILREQIVTILYRYAKDYKHIRIEGTADLSAYSDGGTVREYALDAFRWAIANGIISGYEDNTLKPQGPAKRAEAAAILVRYTDRTWEPAEESGQKEDPSQNE